MHHLNVIKQYTTQNWFVNTTLPSASKHIPQSDRGRENLPVGRNPYTFPSRILTKKGPSFKGFWDLDTSISFVLMILVWSKLRSRSCSTECRSSAVAPIPSIGSLAKAFSCCQGPSQASIGHNSSRSWRSWVPAGTGAGGMAPGSLVAYTHSPSQWPSVPPLFFFFSFFVVPGLELRAYTLCHSTSPFFVMSFFKMES
jgi:hypothetical protein